MPAIRSDVKSQRPSTAYGKELLEKKRTFLQEQLFSSVGRVNPLHPDFGVRILLTVLPTFPMVLAKRICFKIRSPLNW